MICAGGNDAGASLSKIYFSSLRVLTAIAALYLALILTQGSILGQGREDLIETAKNLMDTSWDIHGLICFYITFDIK